MILKLCVYYFNLSSTGIISILETLKYVYVQLCKKRSQKKILIDSYEEKSKCLNN